jgi:hypothetical protein
MDTNSQTSQSYYHFYVTKESVRGHRILFDSTLFCVAIVAVFGIYKAWKKIST